MNLRFGPFRKSAEPMAVAAGQDFRAPVRQPPGCPPGYICTPVGGAATVPALPPGWNAGPQPMGYSSDEITGSVGGYSDD